MSKSPLFVVAVLALTAVAWQSDRAHAVTLNCASIGYIVTDDFMTHVESRRVGSFEEYGAEATFLDRPGEAIRLAQLQSKLQGQVPSGRTYYLQQQGQRAFAKFSAGTTLPNVDCVEVTCPATFPPGATCWRCVEQIKAPE